MEELFLNKEYSILAKEKGFDEPCMAIFTPDGNFQHLLHINADDEFFTFKNSECAEKTCSAPLYQQIIDWFDKKGIYINVWCSIDSEPKWWDWIVNIRTDINTEIFPGEDESNSTKYQALDKAIEEAFKLI